MGHSFLVPIAFNALGKECFVHVARVEFFSLKKVPVGRDFGGPAIHDGWVPLIAYPAIIAFAALVVLPFA